MENVESLNPCHYPTTVCLIDDHRPFIISLCGNLDQMVPFRLYTSPRAALDDIHEIKQAAAPGWPQCLDEDFNNVSVDLNKNPLLFNYAKFHDEVHNINRFSQVSVVVVDYLMPEMDGLEFCRQLQDKNVKIILLTGAADEMVGVRAFNEGLIDRFILKNSKSMLKELNDSIRILQQQYFLDLAKPMKEAMLCTELDFFHDPVFIDFFKTYCQEQEIAEYYLSCFPRGIYVVNQLGKMTFLLVSDELTLRGDLIRAKEYNAPAEMIAQLETLEWNPYLKPTGYISDQSLPNWKSGLFPNQQLAGKETIYYSIIDAESILSDQECQIFPFNDYLEKLISIGINKKTL